ncbi:MAG: peptidyl-prolyl cis-trans isomerase, partial [Gammaproteobacteria bacterium]|nr:peptidyl-prolyl cis-trans isomerase [Gammaproteobacteria bacterium]
MLEKKTREIKISNATLQKFYNDNVATNKQIQYKASHILVKEKSLAESLAKKIETGEDFEKLAKANSIDKGSAEKGGDLGWFNPTTMVPTFAAAVKKATKGKVTAPVQSQFGWHIIKVEDSKPITPPSFADSKEKIKQLLMKQEVSQYIEGLKKKYKV